MTTATQTHVKDLMKQAIEQTQGVFALSDGQFYMADSEIAANMIRHLCGIPKKVVDGRMGYSTCVGILDFVGYHLVMMEETNVDKLLIDTLLELYPENTNVPAEVEELQSRANC